MKNLHMHSTPNPLALSGSYFFQEWMDWFLPSPAFCLYFSHPNFFPFNLAPSKSNIVNPLLHTALFPLLCPSSLSSLSYIFNISLPNVKEIQSSNMQKSLLLKNKKESKTETKQNTLNLASFSHLPIFQFFPSWQLFPSFPYSNFSQFF